MNRWFKAFKVPKVLAKSGCSLGFGSHHIDVRRGNATVRLRTSHAGYLLEVCESFDQYFGAVEPLQLDGRLVADYSTPRLHWVKGFDLQPICFPSLAEPVALTTQYLGEAGLKKGDVVLDLGAYSGLTSILFAQAVGPSGQVIALEPDPESYRIAEQNIRFYAQVTGNQNIKLVNKAAWEHDRGTVFSSDVNRGAGIAELVTKRKLTCSVATTTVEALVGDRLNFIKCDIEGAEAVVLRSAAALISRLRPVLVIESHYVAGVSTAKDCLETLHAIGYKTSLVPQQGFPSYDPLIIARPGAPVAS